jgi:zinc protease
MFQLLHLYMTEPRFDQVALDQTIASQGAVIADPGIDPAAAENDALVDLRYQDELRYTVLPSEAEFDTLDLAGVERVWNQRYGDAGDWVFVFSGDFDIDELVDLSSAYLGTLPGTAGVEQPIDVAPPPPSSVVSTTVSAGTGETASLSMLFTTPIDAIDATTVALADVTTSVVRARLTDVIREQLGDTYSPFATTYVDTDPGPVLETYVNVTGSPQRIDQIAELVVAELTDLADGGPTDEEFANAFAEVREQYNFVDNGQFLDALVDDALDPGRPISGYLDHFFALEGVTAGSVRSFIADGIPTDAYVQVTVRPRA